jgi:hypothetical protein
LAFELRKALYVVMPAHINGAAVVKSMPSGIAASAFASASMYS